MPEDIGRQAAKRLFEEVSRGGAVDSLHQVLGACRRNATIHAQMLSVKECAQHDRGMALQSNSCMHGLHGARSPPERVLLQCAAIRVAMHEQII